MCLPAPACAELLDLDPLPLSALNNPAYEAMYTGKFTHFNPIQVSLCRARTALPLPSCALSLLPVVRPSHALGMGCKGAGMTTIQADIPKLLAAATVYEHV